jgi:hypothetical protein
MGVLIRFSSFVALFVLFASVAFCQVPTPPTKANAAMRARGGNVAAANAYLYSLPAPIGQAERVKDRARPSALDSIV